MLSFVSSVPVQPHTQAQKDTNLLLAEATSCKLLNFGGLNMFHFLFLRSFNLASFLRLFFRLT